MEFNWDKYTVEIGEFLNVETLREIDYGILDLSGIKDCELKEVLLFFEELLTMELKLNYLENETGLFRVQVIENKYYYNEFGYIIESDSIYELKELVQSENRIWYVFDEILAGRLLVQSGGRK
ncbi:hypothetical protein [Methanobrevibacter sp.]|uniref:hypothetical protein n=1 Tax=Methanobrevibacter sp. TaxID=66852 RepID=UPI0025DA437F|nr:hypothetical protein [Methanobrevibacter sp.]MBR4448533.1 hypothetical protein [Methanobrevibacter sp.]